MVGYELRRCRQCTRQFEACVIGNPERVYCSLRCADMAAFEQTARKWCPECGRSVVNGACTGYTCGWQASDQAAGYQRLARAWVEAS